MSADRDEADLGPLDIDSDRESEDRAQKEDASSEQASSEQREPVTPRRRLFSKIRRASSQEESGKSNGFKAENDIDEGTSQDAPDDGDITPLASPAGGRPSSADGSVSAPDDSPSVLSSALSSPQRRSRLASPNPSLRPFDLRFKARQSLSPHFSSRQSSSSFLGHKPRQPSMLSQLTPSEAESESSNSPWEVVRWTKLRKIAGEAFSEPGRRSFGRPTCIAVSSVIALGTSKGVVLVFDYHQNLQAIIGLGTKATESGAITSIALSADHAIVAAGHARGSIFTWEIAKPGKPFLYIAATNISHVQGSKQDGHVEDVSILHIGFLGTRHTALVSADDRGMAFSHLATRGTGAIGRTVRTTRILGRYPEITPSRPKKPSSVLAFSPLPLGNVEAATDSIGLVAMLTPYLLVIVSTTPIAQTQHKAARPKELAAHGALSAALAWYPSMKLGTGQSHSNAKLAYSWLNVLTILEVVEMEPSVASDKERPPEFQFRFRKRWTASESIVAIQWLSRTVLAVVTLTQQLLILEDTTLEVTDSMDLLGKNIYHTDFFSEQLGPLVEKLDEENAQMHGVVADAFYMSFRAYKGRLFLLGYHDVSLGTRSNWADRLIALMEQGDFIASIRLATSFYRGSGNRATVGLPEEAAARQSLVREKLTEMMSASLRYAFGKNAEAGTQKVSDDQLDQLARVCFIACLEIEDTDFLFEEVFTWYHESKAGIIFLRLLETHILQDEITTVPPVVLKELVNDFVDRGQTSQLEELICRLSPETMDLDQITLLCKENQLYDALFYVWSQAIGDFTRILKDLIDKAADEESDITKVFAYLSYILTGRVYPTGEQTDNETADRAKLDIYFLLFSGVSDAASNSPSFTYLRRLLYLDTASFMSMLNEAFEDSFLNGSAELENGKHESTPSEEQRFKLSLNRQYIVRILLQLLIEPNFEPKDIIYLDMFIARNLPKYQQFLLLPGNLLHRVLVELCQYPSEDLVNDCQLSVEYLLSVYQPPDPLSLVPTLSEARFYRVIKSIYSAEKQYASLLETCFADVEHPDSVFETTRDCLRKKSQLTEQQRRDVRKVIVDRAGEFLAAGIVDAADTIERYATDLHNNMLEHLRDDEHAQFEYLREVFEPTRDREPTRAGRRVFVEQYTRLLCDYDPHHISTFVESLKVGDLRLEEVLPALENSSAIDAAVVLMAREGRVRAALDRLIQYLHTLESALLGLIEGATRAPDMANSREATDDLVASIEKYARIGVWLCSTQSAGPQPPSSPVTKRRSMRHRRLPSEYTQADLSPTELLWLDLIDAVVQVMRTLTEAIEPISPLDPPPFETSEPHSYALLLPRLRLLVQSTFSSLLASTSSPDTTTHSRSPTPSQSGPKPAFLPILSSFLARAAATSPSLSHLRSVLANIFAAYAYEEGLLALASRLIAKDLFARSASVRERRNRGWRPLGMACAGCGRRAWGPGAGKGVWEAWEAWAALESVHATGLMGGGTGADGSGNGKGKEREVAKGDEYGNENGKGKARATDAVSTAPPTPSTPSPETAADALVVFACRHLWHRRCLVKAGAAAVGWSAEREESARNGHGQGMISEEEGVERWRCPLETEKGDSGEE